MRGLDRALYPSFRLTWLPLGFIAVLLASVMAHASEYIPRGQPVPQSIRWTNATPTGVGTRASASWTFGGTTSHHTFPVPVSSSTLGKLAGAAVRRGLPIAGWGLVLRDLVNGAGWMIDELHQQVTSQPTGTDAPPGSVVWCSVEIEGLCSSSVAGAVAACNSRWGGCSIRSEDANTLQLNRTPPPGKGDIAQFNKLTITQPTFDWGTGLPAETVPDAVLGQALRNSPEVVNAILIDPVTGAPIRTQELVDALNDLRRSLEAANGVETPGDDVLPSQDFAEPQPSETSWPGFCDWATPVCDFIDWVKAEEPPSERPEVPWEEEPPVASSWTSGLGGGTCPPPVSFTVTVAGVSASPEFDYTGLCSFATSMKPVILALAAIVAAMIIGGIRSTKDA